MLHLGATFMVLMNAMKIEESVAMLCECDIEESGHEDR